MQDLPPEIIRSLIHFHSQFMLERRVEALRSVLSRRTRYLTVVLEDIHQPQNASAVLRTCECYGIQDLHIIEHTNAFRVNPRVVRGAARWLTLIRHCGGGDQSLRALEHLRAQGYRIVATTPQAPKGLEELDVHPGKIALLFGTELQGLSAAAISQAQDLVRIPTVGHTQSLNLSVAVGICVHVLMGRIRSSGLPIGLTPPEHDAILLEWLRQSQRSWRLMEARYFASGPERPLGQSPEGIPSPQGMPIG